MNKDDGRLTDSRASTEPASRLDPERWPSRHEVLAEMKRRHPEKWGRVVNFSYTPGTGEGSTLEQVCATLEAADREMDNPLLRMASRLGGEAFMLRDYAQQQTDLADGYPGKKIPLTQEQKRCARLAALLSECEQLLRDTATARAEGIAQPPTGDPGNG